MGAIAFRAYVADHATEDRMKKHLAAVAALALTGLALAGCSEPAAEEPDKLVLGLVPSQDVDQLVLDAQSLGDLLSDELGIPVETTVTDNYAGLVVAMQTDQAQIGMFGPIALVQAMDQADAEAVLQSVRFGSSTYVTQWFTNNPDKYCSTPIVTNDDGFKFCNGTDTATEGPVGEDALKNVTADTSIAFVDESSASGYYYPATQLQQVAGIDPVDLTGAFFAGGHPNAVLSVARGDAEIGTSFNDAREDAVEEEPAVKDDVVVFAWSTNIPNDGVALGGSLSDELKKKITDAFLAIADTEEGQAALKAVYNIDGLVPADLDALDAARQVEENFGE